MVAIFLDKFISFLLVQLRPTFVLFIFKIYHRKKVKYFLAFLVCLCSTLTLLCIQKQKLVLANFLKVYSSTVAPQLSARLGIDHLVDN